MDKLCYLLFFTLTNSIFSDYAYNDIITSDGCSTKLKQILKPEYPYTDHQGYAVISFSIDANGHIKNSKIKESMCVVDRNSNKEIVFKKCPFFKNKALNASKYLQYQPPRDANNKSCIINYHDHRYNFKLYTINEGRNDFLLRKEFYQKIEKMSGQK